MNSFKRYSDIDEWLNIVLEEGEGYYTEFKENLNNTDKEIVAFANASGGKIFLGITDKGEIKGFRLSNKKKSEIQNIATNCDPPVWIETETYDNFTVIHVPESIRKPHRCASGYYIRNGASSQKMNTDSLIRFIQYEQRYNFDEQLESRYPAEDLDQEKYADFIEKCGISPHYNPEDILVNLGLAIYENKRWRLNNAGILFLGNNPTHYLPQSVVTCVLYKGDEKLHVLDRKDFSGGLLLNMEDAMLFLKKHLKLRYEIKSLRRNEILELPEDALREALVNALAHRNYFEKGANVLVEIFDSSVKITNPGGLPKGLSKKDLGKKSMTRNPLITAMLLRAEYIEKLGTGINRIQYALQQAGLPQAQFEADSFFTISFPRESLEKDTSSDKNSEENRKKIREKTREKTREKIMQLMEDIPDITIADIAKETNISPKGVEWQIRQLKKHGKIRRHGPDKGGYWEVIDTKNK